MRRYDNECCGEINACRAKTHALPGGVLEGGGGLMLPTVHGSCADERITAPDAAVKQLLAEHPYLTRISDWSTVVVAGGSVARSLFKKGYVNRLFQMIKRHEPPLHLQGDSNVGRRSRRSVLSVDSRLLVLSVQHLDHPALIPSPSFHQFSTHLLHVTPHPNLLRHDAEAPQRIFGRRRKLRTRTRGHNPLGKVCL